jgi:hypothetical protein
MSQLPEGEWTIAITYTLDVPDRYYQKIRSYEKKYNITLADRERHILGLLPTREAR